MKIKYQFPHAIKEIEHGTIILSDGCRLAYRMWLPAAALADSAGFTVPAILEYLPYRKRDGTAVRDQLTHPYFAGHGYACLRVDMRGCGESDGLLADEYLQQEQDDAIEVIRWITQQPWSSGKVGMMGISWGGFNGLQIAAQIEAIQPDTLKAVITLCSTDNRFTDDIHYKGGCMLLENAGWAATMFSYGAAAPDPLLVGAGWRELWLQRLKNMPLLLKNWLQHQTFDAYWQHGSVCCDYSKIKAAVYAIGGWGDAYSNAIPRMLENLPGPKKGLIGPWAHKYPHFAVPGPAIGFLQEALRWWDYWLKDIDTGVMDEPQMTLYLQDAVAPQASYAQRPGNWLREVCWPSPHVQALTVPLGAADASCGILRSPLGTGSACGEYCVIWLGPEFPTDQRADDAVSLTVDLPALQAPIALVGAAVLKLRLRCDSEHGQLAVRLNDVSVDGASTRITYGVLNLNLPQNESSPRKLIPGKWFDVTLQLDDVGYRLPAEHRLRIAISSAYFPLVWPARAHATLEFDLAQSAITLPLHDMQTVSASPFAEPEAAAPLALRYQRSPASRRQVVSDAMSGRVTTQIHDDFGRYCFDDHGLVVEQVCDEEYSILPQDPLSASSEQRWLYKAGRGDWQVEVKSVLRLTADAEHFLVEAEQTAWENGRQVHHQDWRELVRRVAL
ncbi:CocE/NonD family hydrolase [Collimonas fungivorans]|uniref:Glutaryl 7-ACA acylase-like protein n=1 Tax=Collimonas fungivorans (strain Ter331) TaxID=1005048 RepID=G0ACF0_COLFT|nr:CocE/NonD family hydrolase [Collimonas fungivorans]AEK62745.1 glutaryl 7-ACA acylase-like protein [Collimonas fungivorans Ter331]